MVVSLRGCVCVCVVHYQTLRPRSQGLNDPAIRCQQQVRWWATLRGQTLGRTIFGLMEMREALVDLAYLELKARLLFPL